MLNQFCKKKFLGLVPVSEPVKDTLFKFTKPKLDFNGDDAVDIGHIAGGKNNS